MENLMAKVGVRIVIGDTGNPDTVAIEVLHEDRPIARRIVPEASKWMEACDIAAMCGISKDEILTIWV